MANTYSLLASTVLTGSQASVTFSGIPQNYTDLVLRVSARTNQASANSGSIKIQFNSDTATNYSDTHLEGYNNTTVASGRETNSTSIYTNIFPDTAGNTANVFDNQEIYIPNYTSTAIKPFNITSVSEGNATTQGALQTLAGLYRGTSGISSLTIFSFSPDSFVSGSSFYLYGISKN